MSEALSTEARQHPCGDVASIEAKREKLVRKRERYVEAFSDGMMTREALHAAMAKLDTELTKLAAAGRVETLIAPTQRRETLAEIETVRRLWSTSKPRERRQIVAGLARSVAMAHDRDAAFEWYSGEELIRRG